MTKSVRRMKKMVSKRNSRRVKKMVSKRTKKVMFKRTRRASRRSKKVMSKRRSYFRIDDMAPVPLRRQVAIAPPMAPDNIAELENQERPPLLPEDDHLQIQRARDQPIQTTTTTNPPSTSNPRFSFYSLGSRSTPRRKSRSMSHYR
jgi:hypothetical protein